MASGAMSVSLMKPSLSCSFSGPLPAASACAHDNKQTARLAKILVLTLTSSPGARGARRRARAITVPAGRVERYSRAGPRLCPRAPKARGGSPARRGNGESVREGDEQRDEERERHDLPEACRVAVVERGPLDDLGGRA